MENRVSKQVLVVRKDLKMRKGKIAAQCAHASLKVILDLGHSRLDVTGSGQAKWFMFYDIDSALNHWLGGSFTKICVYVESEEELLAVFDQAKSADIPTCLITDSGRTEFHGVPTHTVVAVGPAWADQVDEVTGNLPLL